MRTLLRLVDRDLGYPARLEGDGGGARGEDPAERDRRFWLRRFLWAALFSVPVFFLAMVRTGIAWTHPLYHPRPPLTLDIVPSSPFPGVHMHAFACVCAVCHSEDAPWE